MSAEKLYSEIVEEFEKASSEQERVAILRKHDHPRFRTFLKAAFDPLIEFDVPIPIYRPSSEPAGLNFTYLDSEMNKLYRFVKNHPSRPPGLSPKKQSQLLLVVLESLHRDEASLLVKTLQKKLVVKNLTVDLIRKALPGTL